MSTTRFLQARGRFFAVARAVAVDGAMLCNGHRRRRLGRAVASALLLLCAVAAAAPARADRGASRGTRGKTLALISDRFDGERARRAPQAALEHRVARGETLGAIAAHYNVTIDQLREQNPDLDPDRIREGQKLVIGAAGEGRARTRVTVTPGDTLTGIAKQNGVSVADLLRWNPTLSPDRVRAGAELTVFPKKPPSISESIGSPSSGELVHGRRLPPGRGYEIRASDRAYATDETVAGLVSAFTNWLRGDPKAPRLAVHDLSLRNGGRMNQHRSHQSGRDVDIAYPQLQCKDGTCGFRRLAPGDVDARRTFALLRYWLERDMLEAVFVDYRLQAPLYRYARDHGASAEELQRWFQYPHGRDYPLGVIRHFPKHDDHFHVRFACPPSDGECKTFRPLMMRTAQR
jgi:LysM repeat protein